MQRLWRRPAAWPSRALLDPLRFSCAIIRDLSSGHLTLRATGLVFVTILSLVPIIAISFSVLKAFGFHRGMEPALMQLFEPLGEQAATLTTNIIGFVDNTQGNVLAGIGLVLLFITTISMADRIEDSFNFVWRVDRPRTLARRISHYLVVLLVGPVVVVTALGLITMLADTSIFRQVTAWAPIALLYGFWGQVAPWLLICTTFTVIYVFVPNTRVNIGPALIGGTVGGVLWTLAGVLFTRFVVSSSQTLTIYATFAVVIFALLWLYFCWLTLLVGAQVAFYAQNPGYLPVGYRPLGISGQQRETLAMALMWRTAHAFRHGTPHPDLDEVAALIDAPIAALTPVAARLEATGLLTRDEHGRLLPDRDPANIRLTEILDAVREPRTGDVAISGPIPPEVSATMARVRRGIAEALGEDTLGDLAGHPPD